MLNASQEATRALETVAVHVGQYQDLSQIPLREHIHISGPAASGKSMLLGALADYRHLQGAHVMVCDAIPELGFVDSGHYARHGADFAQHARGRESVLDFLRSMIAISRQRERQVHDGAVLAYKDLPDDQRDPVILIVIDDLYQLVYQDPYEDQVNRAITASILHSLYALSVLTDIYIATASQMTRGAGFPSAYESASATRVILGKNSPLTRAAAFSRFSSEDLKNLDDVDVDRFDGLIQIGNQRVRYLSTSYIPRVEKIA